MDDYVKEKRGPDYYILPLNNLGQKIFLHPDVCSHPILRNFRSVHRVLEE